jgi:AcrR family transcriptional regulator
MTTISPHTELSERAQRSRAKILSAAEDVLFDVGRDRFNMTAVAERAQVSIGLVYRYFPTKEALIDELLPQAPLDEVAAVLAQLRKLDKLKLDDSGKWTKAREILGL